jgi:nucleoside-diphosphate-sugar epimerase
MLTESPVLLITGATGLVGGELLKVLRVAKPNRRIAALTRRSGKIADLNLTAGVVALQGDVTHPSLGLDHATYAQLTGSITEIIHCAADTRFGLSLENARTVNTRGTENLLNLASKCRNLQKFAHISTLYVVGRSTGYFPEGFILHHNGFFNTYQQSKYEAEQLVSQAMNDFPVVIFRLSSIIGNSRTGAVRQFNYIHRLIRLFPQNVLPVAPGLPDAPIDFVASDWTIPALAYLFDSAFVPGRFYNICAGWARSLSLQEMIDLTLSIFENHPIGRKWLPIRVPRLVSLPVYEEFVEQRRRDGEKLLNELLRILGYFVPHLALVQVFDNGNVTDALMGSGLEFPPAREYYGKVVHYCLETNWGRHAEAA